MGSGPSASTLRRRSGLLLARAGIVVMVLGGIADLTIRELLPNHRQWLGLASVEVPAPTEALVLALLHALGAALVAAGAGAFVLIGVADRHRVVAPAVMAAFVVLLAEGMNSIGMYRTGSPFFVVPLASLLLALTGVSLYLSAQHRG